MSKNKNKLKKKLRICIIMMLISLAGFISVNKDNVDLGLKIYFKQVTDLKLDSVYYNQEDPRWSELPYDTEESTIGTSGCGVAAMAMILSSMKDKTIDPIELAQYSMENGYCAGYTKRQFFSDIVNEPKYSLQLERLLGYQTEELKELLSDGKHMAIAIMRPGHFTAEGHYIVLDGIETIDGEEYIEVLDPNKDNTNYGEDGQVIYSENRTGRVKASIALFENECDEYWIYSIE